MDDENNNNDDPWYNLHLLASAAVSVSETETKRKRGSKATIPPKPQPRTEAADFRAMPEELRLLIEAEGGDKIRLLMQKRLSATDVSPNHNRLSLPSGCLRPGSSDILAAEESGEFLAIDEAMRPYSLRLKRWKMTRTDIFNLAGDWNSLVFHNSLHQGQLLQLWTFLHCSNLCFAVVIVRH